MLAVAEARPTPSACGAAVCRYSCWRSQRRVTHIQPPGYDPQRLGFCSVSQVHRPKLASERNKWHSCLRQSVLSHPVALPQLRALQLMRSHLCLFPRQFLSTRWLIATWSKSSFVGMEKVCLGNALDCRVCLLTIFRHQRCAHLSIAYSTASEHASGTLKSSHSPPAPQGVTTVCYRQPAAAL